MPKKLPECGICGTFIYDTDLHTWMGWEDGWRGETVHFKCYHVWYEDHIKDSLVRLLKEAEKFYADKENACKTSESVVS